MHAMPRVHMFCDALHHHNKLSDEQGVKHEEMFPCPLIEYTNGDILHVSVWKAAVTADPSRLHGGRLASDPAFVQVVCPHLSCFHCTIESDCE